MGTVPKPGAARWLIAGSSALVLSGCYVGVWFDGATDRTLLDIRQQPQAQTVVVGQSARFDVGAVGTGAIVYQWRRNGANIAGATDSTYLTPPTTLADDGSLFTVRVCDDFACLTSSPALLTVLPR
jgi:hypothetical protein